MQMHTTLWLAHIQSFISLAFLALCAGLSLGLAWLLAWFRLRALGRQADAGWLAAYRFWVRIFALVQALAFAGGVAALITLPALWPGLLERTSAIVSPLLAWTLVIVILFKSCFLGPMLFAERRCKPALHASAVLMVAMGITLTLVALVLLCAWTQTPTGAVLRDGRFVVEDWGQVLRSPAMPWYVGLCLAGSLLCTACLVLAVTAWQGATRSTDMGERLAFRSALGLGLVSVLALTALVPGAARMTAKHQPAKAAAIAAYWHSATPVDWVWFAWPDATQARNRAVLAWRGMDGGYWVGSDAQGQARGLDQFSSMHPPVTLMFFTTRAAWLIGVLLLLTLVFTALRYRQHMPERLPPWLRRWLVWMGSMGAWLLLLGVTILGFGAWPFAVQDALTLDEVRVQAPPAPAWQLLAIVVYAVVCGLLLAAFVTRVCHAARHGVILTAHRRQTC